MTVEDAYNNILSGMYEARVTKDITLRRLSELLNRESIGHLCLIENGKTDPRLSTMLKILDKLDLTLVVVPYDKINDVEGAINNVSKDNTHLVTDYDAFLKWIAWLICEEGNEEANVELLCRRLVKAGYLRIEDDVYKTMEEQ